MPGTTPYPLYDAALLRVQSAHISACVLGLLLVTPAAFALELGEASIKSGIGQPLRVEIPYRLAADEQLTSACIGLVPALRAADALPTYTSVSRISVTSTHIEIFDDRRVREPLIGINVDVHCGTAPRFMRSYELFVDPPAQAPTLLSLSGEVPVAQTPAVIATSVPASSAPIARAARATASPRARGQDGGSLTQGQTYLVVRGDTLSGIAARVTDRPTILQTAEAIFAANPDAFSGGNRDRLQAGRSITIPIMTTAAATLAAPPAPAPLPAIRAAEPVTAVPVPVENPAPAPVTSVAPFEIQPLPAPAPVAEPIAAPVPAAAPAATRTDVAAEAPSQPATGSSSTWLTALLAGGVVILLSAPLAFFRRRKPPAAAAQAGTKVQEAPPRRLIDPVAGIDVVESRLASAPSTAKSTSTRTKIQPATNSGSLLPPEPDLSLPNGPIHSVDLDVGAPVGMNERVDWFAPRSAASANEPTIEASAITVRMPDIDASATLRQPSPKSNAQPPEEIEDEHLTLTVVQLDMLRQDYETEHTLTQQGSKALRDALADLDATKAARAATLETVTLESPKVQSDSRASETKPVRARRKK